MADTEEGRARAPDRLLDRTTAELETPASDEQTKRRMLSPGPTATVDADAATVEAAVAVGKLDTGADETQLKYTNDDPDLC